MLLLDALFAGRCDGCDTPGRALCATCAAELRRPPGPAWPTPAPPGLPPPWAAAAYDGCCRQLLLSYKERGVVGLRGPLGAALAEALVAAAREHAPGAGVVVVPMPSTRAATRGRGDDVVLELARRAAVTARRAGVDARVVAALRHHRRVQDSAGLSAGARAANLSHAFAVRPSAGERLRRRPVVLVDDLITTGATLAEAARALRAAGADVRAAATVAATRRWTG